MLWRRLLVAFALFGVVAGVVTIVRAEPGMRLYAGAAKEDITPFTKAGHAMSNADGLTCGAACGQESPFRAFSAFDGTITASGLWGEKFHDANGNGRFDGGRGGETFTDDPGNTALDEDSAGKWDGIYLAGGEPGRTATGVLDRVWARAAVFAEATEGRELDDDLADNEAMAVVSLDFMGYFSDWTDRIMEQARGLWYTVPARPTYDFYLDRIVLSATRNHQGPDVHIGMWGADAATDGTYPLYERYVERKIAVAVVRAMLEASDQARRQSWTTVRAGAIRSHETFSSKRGNGESLAGLQARGACRTPWLFDDELRAMQASDSKTGATIVSFLNYAAPAESLGREGTAISSDFAGYAREQLESRVGGIALWFPGADGSVNLVGDACASRWKRDEFDGEVFPAAGGKVPFSPARTRAIGRVVGDAAFAALGSGVVDETARLGDVVARDLFVDVTNQGLAALALAGVIDKPGYVAGQAAGDVAGEERPDNQADGPDVPSPGTEARSTLYAFQIGPASFVTAPGDLFPELYFGLSSFNRSSPAAYEHFPYSSYIRCSADARSQDGAGPNRRGRPFEMSLRDKQIARFPGASIHFVLGSTPDTLGPIVPGYDFSILGVPVVSGAGTPFTVSPNGSLDRAAAPDDCANIPVRNDPGVPEIFYRTHHDETLSASSMLAPAVSCTLADLLHPEMNYLLIDDACTDWAKWKRAGAHNPLRHSSRRPYVDDPERNRVRHY